MQTTLDVWNGEEFEAIESTPMSDQAVEDAELLASLGYFTQVRVFGTDVVTAQYRHGGASRIWTGSEDDWVHLVAGR